MEEPPSYHSVQILNQSSFEIELDLIRQAVLICLQLEEAPPSSVRLLITSDEHVASLNERFRRVQGPTDVLTFSDGEAFSGDIAIAASYAQRQARLREIPFLEELILLAIHGTLHLAGLDDEAESDRLEMISRMYRVAARLGYPEAADWGSLLHETEAV